jgi:hypothetical protein
MKYKELLYTVLLILILFRKTNYHLKCLQLIVLIKLKIVVVS